MTKAQRIAHLKANLFSDDWETAKRASDALFHFGGRFNKTGRRKSRQYLLRILDQDTIICQKCCGNDLPKEQI
jgi:hypothetical protein